MSRKSAFRCTCVSDRSSRVTSATVTLESDELYVTTDLNQSAFDGQSNVLCRILFTQYLQYRTVYVHYTLDNKFYFSFFQLSTILVLR